MKIKLLVPLIILYILVTIVLVTTRNTGDTIVDVLRSLVIMAGFIWCTFFVISWALTRENWKLSAQKVVIPAFILVNFIVIYQLGIRMLFYFD
ncbi:hypothetical protein ACERII_05965 [Evansella sp. AB-rgal1]|uniref:hypothetical protein n=1 Tax=Evansella sp. AB-rgal1 TaxID=3242696 RepID=UPI00359E221B